MAQLVRATGSVREMVRDFFDSERRNSEKIQRYTLGLNEDDPIPLYVHQDYPAILFGQDGATVTVKDENAKEQALANGYFEHPGDVQKKGKLNVKTS